MTKERLLNLSKESLISLAEQEDVDFSPEAGKEELVELILEALEEERSEHESSNNPAMRVKETKYDIILERILSPREDEFPIPETYNETYIKLLMRDPLWAYAYWELKDSDLEIFQGGFLASDPFIRVYEIQESLQNTPVSTSYFDIPVKLSDNNWYINLPRAGSSYYLALMYKLGKTEKTLCTSNTIKSPNETYGLLKDGGGIADAGNDLVLLSGLYDFEAPSSKNVIPQRIISFLDAQYIQLKD